MSPYDDPEYNVHLRLGPILASFASGAKATTGNKTATSANVHDRIEFFRNIKLTGVNAITRTSGAATGHALSSLSPKLIVTEGTRVCATCVVGTVAGVGTAGGISSTYADIDSTEELQIKLKWTGDGTATTMDQISADVYLEYQHRMQ
jgi:hypothetical protein